VSKDLLERLQRELPEICSDRDLVNAGLFRSALNLYYLRVRQQGPPFFRFGRQIRYYRPDVLKWMEECFHGVEM
jgi:hypothetical protein